MLSFGVSNFRMESAFRWTGVAPELGPVLPTSFRADHRGHEVLSVRSKEAKSTLEGSGQDWGLPA